MKTVITAATMVASCTLVWAGTAVSATASAGMVQDQPKSEEDRSRRVCRSIRPTGSRLATRVCRLQREWDESAQKTRDGMDSQSRQDTIQNARGG